MRRAVATPSTGEACTERRGQDWSEKTTGSSIELSFCDSRAKETSPKAEDRATAIPTAEEVLFRLEHFLVFE